MLRIALVALALLATAACSSVVSVATTQPASYDYVVEAWGGITLAVAPGMSYPSDSAIPIELHTEKAVRIDSAMCLARVDSRTEGNTIYILLYKEVCTPSSIKSISVPLFGIARGTFEVRYDDQAAGYPHLGTIQVNS